MSEIGGLIILLSGGGGGLLLEFYGSLARMNYSCSWYNPLFLLISVLPVHFAILPMFVVVKVNCLPPVHKISNRY